MDFASALLCQRLRTAHAGFVAAVDAFDGELEGLPQLPWTVLVAPALGYAEAPEYGGDGLLSRQVAEAFGMPSKLIQLNSFGSIARNVELVREALAAEDDGSVLLVSYSKGSAEVRLALAEEGPWSGKVVAWINVGGLLRGTPLVDYEPGNRWTWLLGRGIMLTKAMQGRFTEGLGYDSELLSGPLRVPDGVLAVDLVALSLLGHNEGRVGDRQRQLARYGPNDGYAVALDALLPGAPAYPVWGANHYFRVPEVSRVLYGIYAWLGAQLTA